jgi:anti-sigma regulatory factor (Ser/Thr protein kinase)
MKTTVIAARVRLQLSSRTENVPIVRQALAGLADAIGISAPDVNDIGTAVTEACNNASAHAYGGEEGPLEVDLAVTDGTIVVTVRDRGVGLALDGRSHVEFPTDVDGELTGIGVPLIKGLTTTARWSERAGGGTAVEMMFSAGMMASRGIDSGWDSLEPLAIEPRQLADTIEVAMAPLAVAREVLPRLLRAMAVRAHFSIDRHSDIQRVSSVVLADAPSWAPFGGLQARLVTGTDSLELVIGPIAGDDATLLADAACAIQPELHTSMVHLGGGRQRLLLGLQR